MKRSRVTEDQIICILKENEAGVSVAALVEWRGLCAERRTADPPELRRVRVGLTAPLRPFGARIDSLKRS